MATRMRSRKPQWQTNSEPTHTTCTHHNHTTTHRESTRRPPATANNSPNSHTIKPSSISKNRHGPKAKQTPDLSPHHRSSPAQYTTCTTTQAAYAPGSQKTALLKSPTTYNTRVKVRTLRGGGMSHASKEVYSNL